MSSGFLDQSVQSSLDPGCLCSRNQSWLSASTSRRKRPSAVEATTRASLLTPGGDPSDCQPVQCSSSVARCHACQISPLLANTSGRSSPWFRATMSGVEDRLKSFRPVTSAHGVQALSRGQTDGGSISPDPRLGGTAGVARPSGCRRLAQSGGTPRACRGSSIATIPLSRPVRMYATQSCPPPERHTPAFHRDCEPASGSGCP